MTVQGEIAVQGEPRATQRDETPGAAESRKRNGRRSAGPVWWLPLLMVVATEYKFRRRTNEDSLAGSLDVWTAIELGVYALAGVYLLVRWRPDLRRHVVIIWLVGYCAATAVSAMYAPFPLLAMARSVQLVIILLCIVQWVDVADRQVVHKFLHAYVILVTVSIIVGFAYVAPTTNAQAGRFTWLFTHSVTAGLMIAISCTLTFGMWLTHRVSEMPWPRPVYALILIFNLVALMLTRTRGSIGGGLVGMLVIALIWFDIRRRLELIVVTLITSTALALTVGQPILDYLSRGEDAETIATFNRRTEIWSLAGDTFLERPLHGVGFTAARGVFYDETGLGGAHNAYVNVAVDAGLVGLFWWVGLLGLILTGAWRLRRRIGRSGDPRRFDIVTILGVMACQLVNGVTSESLGAAVSIGGIFLFITAAWLVVVDDELSGGRPSWFVRGDHPTDEPEVSARQSG